MKKPHMELCVFSVFKKILETFFLKAEKVIFEINFIKSIQPKKISFNFIIIWNRRTQRKLIMHSNDVFNIFHTSNISRH